MIPCQTVTLPLFDAAYHGHFYLRASGTQCRHLSDDALLMHIKAIHAQSRGGYGWPRVGRRCWPLAYGWQTIAWLTWYNHTRRHSTLAYVSPMRFEQNWHTAQVMQASS